MKNINIGQKEIIHFIGIGGIGMSGLAQVMKNMRFSIQGSDQKKNKSIYDYIVYLVVPFQYIFLFYFLTSFTLELTILEKIGKILSMGVLCAHAINVAHDLGHRHNKFAQFLSKLLLLSSLNTHFFIEHNRGHHKRVSTKEDPSSARFGENIFSFWLRAVSFGYLSAWNLENSRLKRNRINIISLNNEMIVYQLIQISFLVLIYFIFGLQIMLYFVCCSIIGFLLLETVNYIEHYGLQRNKNESGKYERVQPFHSWNSNHPIGRIMLFELSRHSDHHYNASRKYQILKNHENTPEMPTGYPGMMILSLIPPLWFYVMNSRVKKIIH